MTDNETQAAFPFPDSARTDSDRLAALWRLQQQMIDQHNAACAAFADRAGVRAFQKDWLRRLFVLCEQINKLKAAVYPAASADEQKDPVTPVKAAARASKDWDAELAGHPILTVTPVSAQEVDPLEDFTALYVEVDPNSHILRNANTITCTGIGMNEDAYVYKDCGSGHFTDFQHLVETEWGNPSVGAGGAASPACWALGTNVDDLKGQLDVRSVGCRYYNSGGGVYNLTLNHRKSGVSQASDSSITFATDATAPPPRLYLTIVRTGSTLACLIYQNSSRTSLADTLTIDDDGTACRYVYGTCSYNNPWNYYIDMVVANLDLGEGIRPAPLAGPLAGRGQVGFGLLR